MMGIWALWVYEFEELFMGKTIKDKQGKTKSKELVWLGTYKGIQPVSKTIKSQGEFYES